MSDDKGFMAPVTKQQRGRDGEGQNGERKGGRASKGSSSAPPGERPAKGTYATQAAKQQRAQRRAQDDAKRKAQDKEEWEVDCEAWGERLRKAAAEGAVEEVHSLLAESKGAVGRNSKEYPVDTATMEDVTALHKASMYGHGPVVEALIAAGAELNVVDTHGRTPLMLSCHNGEEAVLKALLESGASTLPKTRGAGATALMMAAQSGQKGAVHLLLEAGAVAQEADASGRTAQTIAEEEGHAEVVEILLAHAIADLKANRGSQKAGVGWKKMRRLKAAAAATRAFQPIKASTAGDQQHCDEESAGRASSSLSSGGLAALLSGSIAMGATTLGWLGASFKNSSFKGSSFKSGGASFTRRRMAQKHAGGVDPSSALGEGLVLAGYSGEAGVDAPPFALELSQLTSDAGTPARLTSSRRRLDRPAVV